MSNSYGMLAFDIGNTNIHMGLWQDNAWRLSWRARTVHDKMPDEYPKPVLPTHSPIHYRTQPVTQWLILHPYLLVVVHC